jgi:hypothetical protein
MSPILAPPQVTQQTVGEEFSKSQPGFVFNESENDESQYCQRFRNETNTNIKPTASTLEFKLPDQVVKEISGSILQVREKTVEVQLESDLVVAFPKELFNENDEFLEPNTSIRYQICENEDGRRFQKFVESPTPTPEEIKTNILSLWDAIPKMK